MKNVNKIPIWFMRQAGRYLPEYREIRSHNKNFLDLCFNPILASKISLQPIMRFDLDFIILFSDILVIPHALGQDVSFLKNHGPSLSPISSSKELKNKNLRLCINKLSNVFETLKILNAKKGEKKLIGFCGGPFTVLNYMIEGGSSQDHKKIKSFISNKKNDALELIKILTEISIEYLKCQVDSGADYIQIFESWAGLLENEDYENFIIKPNQEISVEMKKHSNDIKIIHFPRGSNNNYNIFIQNVLCDVISLDLNFPKEIIEYAKEKEITIQGNLDPNLLLEGGRKMEKRIFEILEKFKKNDHIFNLSHGILPKTQIKNVKKLIELVRNYNVTK